MNACCSGCSSSPFASPSTVRIWRALRLHREHQAGAHRLAVEQDRAGAADAVLAADMRPGLAAILADRIDQRAARLDADIVLLPLTISVISRFSVMRQPAPARGA